MLQSVATFQLYVEYAFTLTRYNFSLPYLQGQGEHVYIGKLETLLLQMEEGNATKELLPNELGHLKICIAMRMECVWKRLNSVLSLSQWMEKLSGFS
jgi:hypothetical protein